MYEIIKLAKDFNKRVSPSVLGIYTDTMTYFSYCYPLYMVNVGCMYNELVNMSVMFSVMIFYDVALLLSKPEYSSERTIT